MVWYSHLFQNFPQFIVIHTVKGFGIVNNAVVGVFLELCCFFDYPMDVGKRNANQSYSEVSSHTGQNGHLQKKSINNKMLEKVWIKGNTPTTVGGKVNSYNHYGEQYGGFS